LRLRFTYFLAFVPAMALVPAVWIATFSESKFPPLLHRQRHGQSIHPYGFSVSSRAS
jgi:hypothetical protein